MCGVYSISFYEIWAEEVFMCYNAAVMIHANRGTCLLFVVVSGYIPRGVPRIAPAARRV